MLGIAARQRGATMATVALLSIMLLLQPMPSHQQITWPSLYNPISKDWHSVLSACLEAGKKEKRYFNFFIRAAFHDSLSTVAGLPCRFGCGGADGSLFTVDELTRVENANDGFANTTGRIVKRIANQYRVSVADTLAVCGMAAMQGLNNGFDGFKETTLLVGKYDSLSSSTPGQLPSEDISPEEFADFFTSRGLTIEEGVALTVGAHALVDEQGCYRGRNNNPRDFCDPFDASSPAPRCTDVRMFKFDNHAFVDACTPSLAMPADTEVPPASIFPDQELPDIDGNEFEALKPHEVCKFSSDEGRYNAYKTMVEVRQKLRAPDVPPRPRDAPVFWANRPKECQAPTVPATMKANCPHPQHWMYTNLDARLGMVCQQNSTALNATESVIRTAMLEYAQDNVAWRSAYAKAYAKMVQNGATWAIKVPITGRECFSGWVAAQRNLFSDITCQLQCSNINNNCPEGCICRTAFWRGIAQPLVDAIISIFNPTPAPMPPPPPPPVPPPTQDTTPERLVAAAQPIGATPDTSSTTPLASPPPSPFSPTCVTANGRSVLVDGFPASPMVLTPFQDELPLLVPAKYSHRACRPDGHCMEAYSVDVMEKQLSPFSRVAPFCATKPTWFLTYAGTVPGPTIRVAVGTEVLMRFNNKITGTFFPTGQAPCTGTRTGRPISIHLHGSASLAPYDGWADDVTCGGESKEYIYPNSRATTAWYHDHGLFVTNINAYAGMASFYMISEDPVKDNSTCKQPFNLDGMEERPLLLGDKVLDSNCQLLFDEQGRHRENLYGDINLVNGVPFPKMSLQPKWYRFRLLNGGPTRPYLIKIKDSSGNDVAPSMCYVVAGDGGWRNTAVRFPATGMFLAVAERYEVVCNFAEHAGETLYLWNDRDDKILKNVPMFCYSHLLAKITVSAAGTVSAPAPVFDKDAGLAERPLTRLLSDTDMAAAIRMAQQGRYERKFVFGRRQGHWVINGETWESNKIAAADVGQNTWELWMLKTGGGWFHPIHIHLVDFIVIQRDGPNGVHPYEQDTPKDVVFLGPSQKIWVIARFGAHRGDYMFHCHNLVHEDNDMLRAFSVVNSTMGGKLNQAPRFTNISESGGIVYSNYGYDNPLYGATNARASTSWPALTQSYVQTLVNNNLYKIFYPTATDSPLLRSASTNPWQQTCADVVTTNTTAAGTTGRKLRLV